MMPVRRRKRSIFTILVFFKTMKMPRRRSRRSRRLLANLSSRLVYSSLNSTSVPNLANGRKRRPPMSRRRLNMSLWLIKSTIQYQRAVSQPRLRNWRNRGSLAPSTHGHVSKAPLVLHQPARARSDQLQRLWTFQLRQAASIVPVFGEAESD
jgi:hypothetical protein